MPDQNLDQEVPVTEPPVAETTTLSYTLDGNALSVSVPKLPETFYFKVDILTKVLLDVATSPNTFDTDPKDMFEYGQYATSTDPMITHYLYRRYIDTNQDPTFDLLIARFMVRTKVSEEGALELVGVDIPVPAQPLEPAEYIPPLPETVAQTQPAVVPAQEPKAE